MTTREQAIELALDYAQRAADQSKYLHVRETFATLSLTYATLATVLTDPLTLTALIEWPGDDIRNATLREAADIVRSSNPHRYATRGDYKSAIITAIEGEQTITPKPPPRIVRGDHPDNR